MSATRRRTKIVNPEAQRRLIVSVSTAPAVGLGVMVSVVCLFCNRLFEESEAAQVTLNGLLPLFLSVTGLGVFTVVVLVISAFQLSHKVAGPAYRCCRSLERIREGDVDFRVVLRKGDHLTEIADELNLLLDALNENPPPGFRTRAMSAAEAVAAGEAGSEEAAEPEPVETVAASD